MKNKNKVTASISASPVKIWLEIETPHQRKALDNASRIFDDNDSFTVNTIEAIYGQETSFGNKNFLGIPGSSKPSGHFQQKKDSAIENGLTVGKNNDERFDIDRAAIGATKQLKNLDNIFSNRTNLGGGLFTSPIKDINERRKFALGAYNIGQGRLAKAQELAKKDGMDPAKWDDVKQYLEESGALFSQAEEARKYVEDVLKNEKEFEKKSKANKKLKDKEPKKESPSPKDGHWVTLDDGRHVLLGNKSK